ncbi:MAG: L-seryl-tRNA(Sec) selenium transferase [Longimicrobiales bacterium]
MSDPRRAIPSVDALMETAAFEAVVERAGRDRVIRELRRVQDALRALLADNAEEAPSADALDPEWFAARVTEALDRADTPSLRRVINATGVVLHTNLGRAPLAEPAIRAMVHVAAYSTLEYDLEAGQRGSRYDHCVGLLRELTGAEDALVVNNNAAAVVLALNTLAEGRAAVISRGELVEIGGSFRVSEIMARSGARMREVGATNRTHLADYEAALDGAALILKVHRSNFRVEGFTAEAGIPELTGLAADRGIPLVHDLGSGAILDMTRLGLPAEPTAAASLDAGAHVVTMSGDKLLGGPQAGIIVGDEASVAAMRANPLCRALRPDKLTLAALEATLTLYRDPDNAIREIPTLRMLAAEPAALAERAGALADRLREVGAEASVQPTVGAVGGGAYPGVELPGHAVVLGHRDPDGLARRLRAGSPPVIGRVQDGRLRLDPRTVAPGDEDALVAAVETAAHALDAEAPEDG